MDQIEQARKFFRAEVERWHTENSDDPSTVFFTDYATRYGVEVVGRGDSEILVINDDCMNDLYQCALEEENARNLLATKVASKVTANVPLHEIEYQFLIEALFGELPAIRRNRGRSATDNLARNVFIIRTLERARERFDIPLSRNDATDTSFCLFDLLADAFAGTKHNGVGYRAIKDIWHNKAFRRRLDGWHTDLRNGGRMPAVASRGRLGGFGPTLESSGPRRKV